ncbi:MAG: GntR family transcriptional regulator [Clostridiales bacterium]|nr:GntR family transcriptional regulator [Clostridiales bacterium]
MNIIISNSSMQPIYEQIIGQIKAMIMDGRLKEETMLPSVRSLSKDLNISALTVKKAYDNLESEGFIVTVHGKGSFVAKGNRNLLQEEKRKAVETKLELAIQEGRNCGMKDDEIRELFELILEE